VARYDERITGRTSVRRPPERTGRQQKIDSIVAAGHTKFIAHKKDFSQKV
jgi:hypothetical protein